MAFGAEVIPFGWLVPPHQRDAFIDGMREIRGEG